MQQDVAKAQAIAVRSGQGRATRKSIAARRVYKEDKSGDRTYLSDEDADAYREQARQAVQDACGSVPEWKPDAADPRAAAHQSAADPGAEGQAAASDAPEPDLALRFLRVAAQVPRKVRGAPATISVHASDAL